MPASLRVARTEPSSYVRAQRAAPAGLRSRLGEEPLGGVAIHITLRAVAEDLAERCGQILGVARRDAAHGLGHQRAIGVEAASAVHVEGVAPAMPPAWGGYCARPRPHPAREAGGTLSVVSACLLTVTNGIRVNYS